MTPFRIGNIMLGTTDLERSLRFYSTMLDFPVQNFRDPDGHLLSIFGPEHAPSVVP